MREDLLDRVMPTFFAATTFVGAFLLFLVEPIIAKELLPWFGGAANVWATCLVFFQTGLLVGYVYADVLARHLSARRQLVLQLVLLSVGALTLPIVPAARWKPLGSENPALMTLGALATTVGVPYVLMAATAPLVQTWYVRRYPQRSPYRLFALSNAASMLALLLYPAVVEPWIGTRSQSWSWSVAYVAWAALMIVCSLAAQPRAGPASAVTADSGRGSAAVEPAPTNRESFAWIGLAALGSFLLVAVTNYMTRDIAAIPLLWILPLAIYLLTFIVSFQEHRWLTPATLFTCAVTAMLVYSAYTVYSESDEAELPVWAELVIACVVLGCACLFCHGRLASTKPAPRYLTRYYLMIALGGALGSSVISLAAPALLPVDFDWQVGMAVCAATLLWCVRRQRSMLALVSVGALAAVGYADAVVVNDFYDGTVLTRRNFYGSLRVTETPAGEKGTERALSNGVIEHGTQYSAPAFVKRPTAYFGATSGVGRAFKHLQTLPGPHEVGVIGLGAGTLAAYGQRGDVMRFYEINPAVIEIAGREFSYLRDSAASTEVVLGDARLSLERETPRHFDLLVVDAFTSDSIPIHLLSREALDLYLTRLKPDGVLAIHTSNRYVSLPPVIGRLTAARGLAARLIEDRPAEAEEDVYNSSSWVLIARSSKYFESAEIAAAAVAMPTTTARPWTDDYSNLLRFLNWADE